MKIGLFADSHAADTERTCVNRRPVLSYGKIKTAMTAFADAGVDLVVCLGDLEDDCGSRDANIAKLQELTDMIRSFGLPFYSLMGNHDCTNFTKDEFDSFTGGAYPPFSLVSGNVLLIFADANYTKAGEVYEPGKVDWVDTKLPDGQVELLRQILRENPQKNAYLFTHQNLDPAVEEHHIIANAAEVRAILEDAGNVRAVISGHYHPGHENEIAGIRYHTLAAQCVEETNPFEILEIE